MTKPTILQIGPKPPQGFGIVAYIEGLLGSNLSKKYQFIFLNTKGSKIFRVNKLFRAVLTLYHSLILIIILIFRRPDLVHVHTSSGTSFLEKSLLGIICKCFGVKVIFHIHGADFDQFCFRGNNRIFVPKILSLMDKSIILSNAWYERFKEVIPSKKMTIIPNAVDVNDFLFEQKKKGRNESVNILFVGSICNRKGLVDLAYAVRNLIDSGSVKFYLDILGGEENREEMIEITRIYQKLELENFMKFHGPKYYSEKITFFKNADIFVLPSYNESFGIVNLEAMASGLPIISTKVGAIPEYLVNGENGFIINPGDIEQLTKSLKILIEDTKLREKMGNNNRQKVIEKYDWSIVSREIDSLYQSLLV